MVSNLAGRGRQRIVGLDMRENQAMRGLAQALGFAVEPGGAAGDEDIRLVLRLAPEAG
jgi:hypothetical protein